VSNNKGLLKISDLPNSIIEEISNIIHAFSAPLIKVSLDRFGKETISLIGSGTFITVGDAAGILTAEHVVKLLDDSSFLGPAKFLGLPIRRHEHRYVIEREYLRIHRIARGTVDSEGPDLAFIGIPSAELGTIKAVKSFYNLQQNRDRMLSSPPELTLGVWAICGWPDIQTRSEKPSQNFYDIKGFHSLCGFGGIGCIYVVGEYDYLDFDVEYDCSSDIPESFGGVSGGGIWQVPLVQMPNGEMKPQEYLLSGVAFYQTKKSGLHRSIKCHARKSVYEIAYRAIKEIRS
jgi:hypothetical protein